MEEQMAKDITLADIAAVVGVSNVAVSKALSGKPGVSEELRARIKQTAEELGYVSGKGSAAKTGNVGVIIPEHYYGYSVSFYRQLYEYVVKALYGQKLFGILELLTGEDEAAGNMPKVMQEGKVDGLILLGQIQESYIKKMVQQTELPVFFLDTYMSSVPIDTVISDGYHGTYLLTNYLIQQGHRKIAFVGNPDATSSIADRYWGYRRALREKQIPFEAGWEIPDRDRAGRDYKIALDPAQKIDAYVCNSDFTAYNLMQQLKERGISVPEDVSVVGFDDFLAMEIEDNRITSYKVDMERMAQVCVESLLKKIRKEPYTQGIQIVTGKIVPKETVKAK